MSNSQTKEKAVRVFELAKELNLESKVLLDYCKDLGFADVKNQLKGLSGDQVDALKDRARKGNRPAAPSLPPLAPARPAQLPPAGKLDSKIQTIPKAKPTAPPRVEAPTEPSVEVAPPVEAVVPPPPVAEAAPEPVVETTPEPMTEPAPRPTTPPARPQNVIPSINPGGNRPLNLNRPAAPRPAAPSRPADPIPSDPVAEAPSAAPVQPAVPPPAPVEPTPPPAPVAEAPTPADAPPKPALPTGGGPVPGRAGTVPPTVRPGGPAPMGMGSPSRPLGQGGPPRPLGPGGPGLPPRPPQPSAGPPRPQGPGGPPPQYGPPRPQGQGPGGPPRPPQYGPPRPQGQGPGPGGPSQGGAGPGHPPRPGMKGPPIIPPPKPPGQQVKLTPEMVEKLRKMSQQGRKVSLDDIRRTGDLPPQPGDNRGPGVRPGGPPRGPVRPPLGTVPGDGFSGAEGEGSGDRRDGGGAGGGAAGAKKTGPGGVIGRDDRHKSRQVKGRTSGPGPDSRSISISGGRVDIIETGRTWARGPRRHQKGKNRTTTVITGPVEISPPVNVRSLSEAIGMKTGELILKLKKETNKLYAINSNIEFEVAELIAVEKGITLTLKKVDTAEDKVLAEFQERAETVDPELLEPRPPIVTIMGHVDHGKTSLLDKIRQEYGVHSDVVSTEAGGITQVIRAWQVQKDDRRITFLDTPGHEAFTKMRARGAKVTDIAVIVVAATDGVMPQTEEAINHAKAADVEIVVAINKIDMPNANLDKTRRQLYGLGLLPDNMGGDVPFVETSAVTGQGIADLLETINLVADVADLKADPSHPGSGTCLEAYLEGQEGVIATLIVQQGTLRRGDIMLCGATYGRVRAMYNDMGELIDEAGPSTPVRITGLDEVPNADDQFFAVDEITLAREIAEDRKDRQHRASQQAFAPVSLESLTAQRAKIKITELKVILKAEARGSVEAIRKELEKLVHEEVRTRVLHAGIGAINESDVILALTSPDDTMVIGFNVTADDPALRLAENRNINIREFDIIYKLVDAVKSALEGKLKPVEEVVHLGRAIVRDTFKISKVGTIAGCYVTSGTIERSARVRVIRQGVVIYPPSEKVVGLDSLKRFKDDAKEVREGFECGLKISGFDDIKVDDVIEAFKIEVKQRTL